jgi:hypothetical protein
MEDTQCNITFRQYTVLTKARHRSLSCATWIQSAPSNYIGLKPILVLSFPLRPDLPYGLFPSGFKNNIFHSFLFSPYVPHALANSHSRFACSLSVQIMEILIMQFSPACCHFIALRSNYSPQHPLLKRPQWFSFLNQRYQFWYPYETTDKITDFYVLLLFVIFIAVVTSCCH